MVPDSVAIANLIFTYAELLDSGDLDGIGQLFTLGEFRGMHGGPYRGAAEVTEAFRVNLRIYDDGLPWQKHLTTNLQIEISADDRTATCKSVFTAMQERPGTKKLGVIGVGRYLDEFVKEDGTWRFSKRQLIRDLTGDLSAAVPN